METEGVSDKLLVVVCFLYGFKMKTTLSTSIRNCHEETIQFSRFLPSFDKTKNDEVLVLAFKLR